MTFPQGGSEYGGVPGFIQPAPHDIAESPYEQAALAVQTETADPVSPLSSVEGVLAQRLAEGRTRP